MNPQKQQLQAPELQMQELTKIIDVFLERKKIQKQLN